MGDPSFSGHLVPIRVFDEQIVAQTGSIISPSIDLRRFKRVETLRFRARSVLGVGDVKVEYALGSGEQTADFTSFDDFDDLVASSLLVYPSGPEDWHSLLLPIFADLFCRFKVTGVAANPADTLVSAVLMARE